MKTYVMLSNLTPGGTKTVKEHPERIAQVNKEVQSWGAKILAQYCLLGPYDFLTILQTNDEKTMYKIAIELGARGTLETTTFQAIPINDLLEDIGKMKT
jgi:uncharacterized protein with GYD domain